MDKVRFGHQAIDAHARARVAEQAFNYKSEAQDVVVCAERIARAQKNTHGNNDLPKF
ncbi:MAG: hypothetical protein ACPF8W_00140 [Luminiphilus sp.]